MHGHSGGKEFRVDTNKGGVQLARSPGMAGDAEQGRQEQMPPGTQEMHRGVLPDPFHSISFLSLNLHPSGRSPSRTRRDFCHLL